MARTTVTAVRQTMQTTLDAATLTAFIGDAALWVTETLVPAGGQSEARLELIERYLACALARCRDVGIVSVTRGAISERYQMDSVLSDYLHRAAALDSTGLVRQHFLAPQPSAAPVTYGVAYRVGQGFTDDTS